MLHSNGNRRACGEDKQKCTELIFVQQILCRPPTDPEGERRDDGDGEKEWENNYGAIIARAGPKVKSASSNHLDSWRFSSEPVTKMEEREKREHGENAYDTKNVAKVKFVNPSSVSWSLNQLILRLTKARTE